MSSVADAYRPGLEVALDAPPALLARRARFGLLMNQASVDRGFRLAHELLAARFPGQLAALFSPQHGLFAEQQDNMVESGHGRDPLTGAPVYSLYSETRKPRKEWLEGLDAFVIDLQDVGCRVYTFAWTVSYCLEACAAAGLPVIVLDRPNPLGGEAVEGAWLDPRFASFVGRTPMPMRHDLTMGELAHWLNATLAIGADVEVVRCDGLRREQRWRELGRPWVPTSPNLPRIEGVDVYPGQVLFEGTMLSEGRGTTTPFEIWGGPSIDPWKLRAAMEEYELPGVALRPIRFEPTFQKFRGVSCGGLFLHVTDERAFLPYRTSVALLAAVKQLWPASILWKAPPYEYEREKRPIDCIAGSDALRLALDRGELAGARGLSKLEVLCGGERARWRSATASARLYE